MVCFVSPLVLFIRDATTILQELFQRSNEVMHIKYLAQLFLFLPRKILTTLLQENHREFPKGGINKQINTVVPETCYTKNYLISFFFVFLPKVLALLEGNLMKSVQNCNIHIETDTR